MSFDESKHPRDDEGKFTEKSPDGFGGTHQPTEAEEERLRQMGITGSTERQKTGSGEGKKLYDSRDDFSTLKQRLQKELPKEPLVVKVNLEDEIQKQLNNASPKERQKIAFRYIMENLCGEYTASDGRTVSISSVGADKITHRNIEIKLRVSPKLADLIRVGEFQGVKDVEHKKFCKFAYYKVAFQIGNEKYIGLLNVGVRKDGSSTLYDLNPFNKQ